ncbi:fimbrial protein [Stenotrophomonas sp. BIGb0135]|jgi:type 1 fimbria pilin|uniref:fimbrial protein n=1 Tax=Stenotrophomonas sp. BIGb0135 TaxID=2940620 RepID=UPI0021691C81|nr:fimbrial protein [Stenotrophomonas sp. BIGb0135]MCS4233039.1 type 1 fimbria pilin [Stenotrophomonas sp. BIGb0135]
MSTLMRSRLLLTAVLLGGLAPARAQNVGTANVTLNGSIGPGTCTVAAVNERFPTVMANTFNSNPANENSNSASWLPFHLTLTGCAGVTGATLVFGTAADAEPSRVSMFRNKATADAAPYAAIWLRPTTDCATGGTIAPAGTRNETISGATHQVPLCALYVKLAGGVVTRGTISTTFTVTITYR